ncbi:MAG: FtsW/RodA/SpoVE family cell cycle protein, partial [Clostridia bacterium]|nr:FtsW/RodA/SpoVE family cell cycle protein [Clostridia bacterium]
MKGFFSMIADYIREVDKIMLSLAIMASTYGCLAVFSATHPSGSPRQFIVQTVSMLGGIVVAIIISNIDFNDIIRFWYLAVPIGLIPVILTFFIGYAPGDTDDKAWLLLPGGVSFQPSELLKICFIITFSAHISAVKKNINKIRVLLPVLAHGIFPVGLIFIQGDVGTAIIFAAMFVFMLFAAGIDLKYIIIAVVSALVASPFVYFFVLNDTHRER